MTSDDVNVANAMSSKIWKEFKKSRNGETFYFRIQTITNNLKEKCVELMSSFFLQDEHILSSIGK